ncbi:MAG: hypothetical protein R3D03_14180 [Geminicoccaceae bacterium]
MAAGDMTGFMGDHASHLIEALAAHQQAGVDEQVLPARDEGVQPRIGDRNLRSSPDPDRARLQRTAGRPPARIRSISSSRMSCWATADCTASISASKASTSLARKLLDRALGPLVPLRCPWSNRSPDKPWARQGQQAAYLNKGTASCLPEQGQQAAYLDKGSKLPTMPYLTSILPLWHH